MGRCVPIRGEQDIMDMTDKERLQRLGSGETIASICAADGNTLETFRVWWTNQLAARLPRIEGAKQAWVEGGVEILRDDWGIPHIYVDSDDGLFFGYGYAMAQDRLWQLDYLRCKSVGRLSEILGTGGLESDVIARTVGINRLARQAIDKLPAKTMARLQAFSRGVNTVMEECRNNLPIEFDLLGYEPEPWSPLDSVAIWREFGWYLTGRLPVIVIPELAKRTLGEGALYEAFLKGEAADESIVPKGSYPSTRSGVLKVGDVVGDPDEGIGSNNWVVSGERSTTGSPMLASDPHIAFGSVSCWYEVHLCRGEFNVVGTGYVGIPAVMFGRNENLAWGITNNICSQRDLFQEQTTLDHPGHFLYDGKWEPARTITEEIVVKGGDRVAKTVTFSRNGPIVDELLPPPARDTGPVSLRWLGAAFSDELTCLLNLNASQSCDEARAALKDWVVPTWSFVLGDKDGHIGYQCVGRIPIRNGWDRAYRPGWDPEHQWQGIVPFESLPVLSDPPQGYARSANNRTAPEDFPYPLSGTWSSGHRARRIRIMIEEKDRLSREDFARMQQDVRSLRAVEAVPGLLKILAQVSDSRVQRAAKYLRAWDGGMGADQVAASIFDVFFSMWSQAIAAERFPEDVAALVAPAAAGLAIELLSGDKIGWFLNTSGNEAVQRSMVEALDELEHRLGADMSRWQWGGIHTITLKHHLSGMGDVSKLLQRGGQPVGGNGTTVCNTGFDPNYLAAMGANYRLIADLSEVPSGLWAVDAAGQSGHPGSPHYCDQLPEWLAGRHHYLPLDRERANAAAKHRLLLTPASRS